jgi:hypothetical protein
MSKQVVTLRLDEELVDIIDREADARGRNRSDYLRDILHNQHDYSPNTGSNTTDYDRLRERVDRLETLVEDGAGVEDDGEASASDAGWRERLRTWLQEHVPAKRHDDVLALAALLERERSLSRQRAVEDEEIVSAWAWQESKDHLAASPVAERVDQRTWRWAGQE